MDMFSLPYIFKNDAHYWYCIQHPEIDKFMAQLEKKGIKRISWITSGARSLFTQKPVHKPADLKGMKIRVMASPVMINTMKAIADRCCGRCREQPAVPDFDEVL
jgi:TRAP-type C4-dicarboxylate transport system substrate-binding protein